MNLQHWVSQLWSYSTGFSVMTFLHGGIKILWKNKCGVIRNPNQHGQPTPKSNQSAPLTPCLSVIQHTKINRSTRSEFCVRTASVGRAGGDPRRRITAPVKRGKTTAGCSRRGIPQAVPACQTLKRGWKFPGVKAHFIIPCLVGRPHKKHANHTTCVSQVEAAHLNRFANLGL